MRVLHIIGRMNCGGAENFIMNIYRNIDRTKIQFDFVVHTEEECYFDDEIQALGGKIYRIAPISKNIFKHMSQLKKIIKENGYKVVHRHTNASIVAIDLKVAKSVGVEKIIVHSHNTQSSKKNNFKLFKKMIDKYATHKFACSIEAGEWLYGKGKDFQIIKNGIDTLKYKFDKEIAIKKKDELGLNDSFVIGHVGRFNIQKNHMFLLDIFYEYLKLNDKAKLLLVGDGELRSDIENRVKELGIKDKIILTGVRSDVNELMMAMDVFLFPSLHEGLPLTLVEAQACGLKVLGSDVIPRDVAITSLYNFFEIGESSKKWAARLDLLKYEIQQNRDEFLDVKNIVDFDVKNVSKQLEEVYYG